MLVSRGSTTAGLPQSLPADDWAPDYDLGSERSQQIHDGEDPGRGPIVYYQIEARRWNERPASQEEDCPAAGQAELDVRRHGNLRISYFFYYSSETGVNAHWHDLERADVEVDLLHVKPDDSPSPSGETCVVAVPREYIGQAHGLAWTANRYRVSDLLAANLQETASLVSRYELDGDDPQTAIELERAEGVGMPIEAPPVVAASPFTRPMTFLVEEGKHATCPDANGDGQYTPGADVNRFVNDAWGVRDNFGASRIGRTASAEMVRRRSPAQRVFPPLRIFSKDAVVPAPVYPWEMTDEVTSADYQKAIREEYECGSGMKWGSDTYDLVRADRKFCSHAEDDALEDRRKTPAAWDADLADRCRAQGFGTPLAAPRRPPFLRVGWKEALSLGVLVGDEVRGAAYLGLWNLPTVDGWLGLRLTWPPRAEVFYTPSAARWLDWYVIPLSTARPIAMVEAGVKTRVAISNIWKRAPGVLSFLGLRFGVRLDECRIPGCNRFFSRQPSLVFEIGGGAW